MESRHNLSVIQTLDLILRDEAQGKTDDLNQYERRLLRSIVSQAMGFELANIDLENFPFSKLHTIWEAFISALLTDSSEDRLQVKHFFRNRRTPDNLKTALRTDVTRARMKPVCHGGNKRDLVQNFNEWLEERMGTFDIPNDATLKPAVITTIHQRTVTTTVEERTVVTVQQHAAQEALLGTPQKRTRRPTERLTFDLSPDSTQGITTQSISYDDFLDVVQQNTFCNNTGHQEVRWNRSIGAASSVFDVLCKRGLTLVQAKQLKRKFENDKAAVTKRAKKRKTTDDTNRAPVEAPLSLSTAEPSAPLQPPQQQPPQPAQQSLINFARRKDSNHARSQPQTGNGSKASCILPCKACEAFHILHSRDPRAPDSEQLRDAKNAMPQNVSGMYNDGENILFKHIQRHFFDGVTQIKWKTKVIPAWDTLGATMNFAFKFNIRNRGIQSLKQKWKDLKKSKQK